MTAPKEKIRVLRIINRFNLGGPTFNVAFLTRYLDDSFETKLVGGMKDESEASSDFILQRLEIEPVIVSEMKRSISPIEDFKAYREIEQIIREYKPHIVHTHASKSGTIGRLAAHRNNVPVILHTFHGHVFHSYFSSFKTYIYKRIERWLAKRSTRIIAISDIQRYELSTLHHIARQDKIEVVPLGFDLHKFKDDQEKKREVFRDRFKLDDEHVAIGVIGRLVPIKNHTMFIDAIKPLIKTHPNARFFIVGGGELDETLRQYCRDQGVPHTWVDPPTAENPLCFTSWIQDIDVAMAGLDIVALTSLNEGTPVSLIEAQAAQKPVVSTRVGGIEDIVVEEGSAFLCNVDDAPLFTHHISKLIEEPTKRSAMGKIGRAHVMDQYSFRRLVEDMNNLYYTLLREKGILPNQ